MHCRVWGMDKGDGCGGMVGLGGTDRCRQLQRSSVGSCPLLGSLLYIVDCSSSVRSSVRRSSLV